MKVVTALQMREIDRRAMEDFKIPGIVLMENAGKSVVDIVREKLGGVVYGKNVAVFCGKGNNGGDGLVAARHLFNMGADVRVIFLEKPEKITGDAAVNLEIWQRTGQKIYTVAQKEDLNAVRLILVRTDIIIDAIYGTGFRGKVKDLPGRVIEAVNAAGKPVIAVDVPSGLEADTGSVNGPCIRAGITVAFGLPKVGVLLEPGAGYAGELRVADISIPPVLLDDEKLNCNLVDFNMVRGWLTPRSSSSHKGDYGRVLVLGGSRGMAGAACLAAGAAARIGAGLVTLVVPGAIYYPVASLLPEVMVYPAPGEEAFSKEAMAVISGMLERADVLAIGPGLSAGPETGELVRKILASVCIPTVLDADGLNALAGHTGIFKKVKAPLVITPHPGEMARLAGMATDGVQRDRLGVARSFSADWGVTLVLKGAKSIIALPDGTAYINPTGNPGMATGGSGDVLTGVIAGLIAQGMDVAGAAAAGVYIHGLAGDRAALEKGMMGLIAGDILEALPLATRFVEIGETKYGDGLAGISNFR
ncbi:MAG: NAD(P)H-hydrate dehydratase [Bacillota bacterium]